MSGAVDFDQEVTAQAPPASSSAGPVNSSFSTNSFVQRNITVVVQLGQGSFGDSGFNTITLEGLRVVASIQKQGHPGFGAANIRISGIPLQIMNQLSSLGTVLPGSAGRNNIVTVMAGDAINGMSTVYKGTTLNAWADLNDMPETTFNFDLLTAAFDAMAPIPPTTFPGAADVATIISGLALQMGKTFENNGVQVQLASPYLCGTAVDQAYACADQAHIEIAFDNDTLAIWPRNGTRGGAIPLISAASGMIGYPQYTSGGVRLRTIFNPSIVFGGKVQVQSTITPANGIWYVNQLTYDLSSQLPGGPWFSDILATKIPGAPAV